MKCLSSDESNQTRRTANHVAHLRVSRRIYKTCDFESKYRRLPETLSQKPQKCVDFTKTTLSSLVLRVFPGFRMYSNYDLKSDLICDVISGLTVAILHLPQGMAYAMLANLPPYVGLYTSLFPAIMYIFFGTSKHISAGTGAVVCLLLGTAVSQYTASLDEHRSSMWSNTSQPETIITVNMSGDTSVSKTDFDNQKILFAATICLMVGLLQIAFAMARLGCLATYISEPVISGSLTAVAVELIFSQIKSLLGLDIQVESGYFPSLTRMIAIFENIQDTNIPTLVVSSICLIVLLVVKTQINYRYKDSLKIPIPIDFIILSVGTVISYFVELNEKYDVEVIGKIPLGYERILESYMGVMSGQGIFSRVIWLNVYSSCESMREKESNMDVLRGKGNLYTRGKNLKVQSPILGKPSDWTNRFLPLGKRFPCPFITPKDSIDLTCLICHFHGQTLSYMARFPTPTVPFVSEIHLYISSIITIAVVSFAQTISVAKLIANKHNYSVDDNQEMLASGICNAFASFFSCMPIGGSLSRTSVQETLGRTQVVSVVSVLVLLVVMLFIGPWFESLPTCTLAAIIVVAFLQMIMLAKDAKRYWNTCKWDFVIWTTTFVISIVVTFEVGICIGIFVGIWSVVYRTQRTKTTSLENILKTELYRDREEYKTHSNPGVHIVGFKSPIYFANADNYVQMVKKTTGIYPSEIKSLYSADQDNEIKKKEILEEELEIMKINQKNGPLKNVSYTEESCDDAPHNSVQSIVLDFTSVLFVDSVGCKMLQKIVADYSHISIKVLLAGVNEQVWSTLKKMGFLAKHEDSVYLTVNDAVAALTEMLVGENHNYICSKLRANEKDSQK